MKYINLTQGKRTKVDDADFERLSKWRWYYSHGYAMRDTSRGRVYLHRFINETPEGVPTDHINRDKLDNQRQNLRATTRSMNQVNRGLQSNNTSGHTGVTWFARDKVWKVQIKRHGLNRHIGYYETVADAVIARRKAELIYHV